MQLQKIVFLFFFIGIICVDGDSHQDEKGGASTTLAPPTEPTTTTIKAANLLENSLTSSAPPGFNAGWFRGFAATTPDPNRVFPGTYIIVAPATVRPGLPYAVSVDVQKAPESEVIIRVEIRTETNKTIASRVKPLQRIGSPQTIVIEQVPADGVIADEKYFVYVKGETLNSRTIFEDQKQITCNLKSLSVFVQTDKAVYKPGSTVHYRVVVTNPDLSPYTQPINMYIDDPNHNRITNIQKAQLNRGVYSGELELSSEPPLGDWMIHVETPNGVKFEKEFRTYRYVLPKFDVNIKTAPFITIKDDLIVNVEAKYTYGKGVAGKAKVTVELPFRSYWVQRDLPPAIIEDNLSSTKNQDGAIELTSKLNGMGEATFTFSNEDLRKHNLFDRFGVSNLHIIASVSEALTEIQRNSTTEITVYTHDVKLEIEKQGDTYKPGLIYNAVVALKQMDDTPVKSTLPRRVQVITYYYFANGRSDEEKTTKVLDLDAHGTAILQLQPPLNCTSLRIEASYDRDGNDNFTNSQIFQSEYVDSARSLSNAFLQVTADNQGSIDVGKPLSFSVRTTESLPSITYQVVARGIVVLTQDMPLNGDTATISLTATPQMAPKARLVVYAIRPQNKEVLADAIDFKCDGLFRNNVSLVIDKTLVEPGAPVKFVVRAAPDSFVGLMAVDQSVILLKSGNDITKEMVEQDVEEYDTTTSGRRRGFWDFRRSRNRRSIWYPWWGVGGKDASSIFENSGLVVLTDAYLHREPEPIMINKVAFAPEMAVPVSAIAASSSAGSALITRVRQNFPETWFWPSDLHINNKQEKGYNIRYVSVPGGGVSKAVYFPIMPTTVGMIKLSLVAQAGANAGDAIEQFLRVEPEGYRVNRNVPLIVDLTSGSNRSPPNTPTISEHSTTLSPESPNKASPKKTVEFQWPSDYVQGSRKASIEVIGDIMGPVLSSAERLVQMPFGCGEQNMVTLVPNIVVLRYLRGTHRNDPKIEQKALKYIESGYQRELTYIRSDNSFSAFGQSDNQGSTWLTAFVVRSLKQAQSYVFIDEQILEKSIAFLNSQQQSETGAFAERGEIHHKAMQGGASEGGLALTAYVLIAMLENQVSNDRARMYLESHLSNIKDDPYSLAVVAYALHLANSARKTEALKMLESNQVVGQDGGAHWSTKPKSEKAKGGMQQSPPADIEATSYALLTYMLLDDKERALPLVRWLTSQRNALGGFSSTQDTVMALQALGAYAEKAYSPSFNVTLNVQNGGDNFQFNINQENAIVLQSHEITNFDDPVEIDASGTTFAFVQVQYSYHRLVTRDDAFFCSKDVKKVRGDNRLQMDLCCNYTRHGHSNMVVAEVDALSGYKFDDNEVQKLTGVNDLQRVELEHENSKLNIYFNPLNEDPVCLSLFSDMQYQVVDQKPAQFHLYDYYDPDIQLKSSYSSAQIRERSIGDVCPDCWQTDSEQTHSGLNGGVSRRPPSSAGSSNNYKGLLPYLQAVAVLWMIVSSCT